MKDKTSYTLDYYNQQAEEFVNSTVDVDFSDIQNQFIKMLPKGSTILDLGCGSGRDSKAFKNAGYKVIAVDGSEELCKIASKHIGQEVICSTFQDLELSEEIDGIWACASLLHLEKEEIIYIINKLSKNLKPGGILYASFKYGDFTGERNGRFFTDMTEESFSIMMNDIKDLKVIKQMTSDDVREDKTIKWLNVFLKKENVLL
jgi:SAM-dependent methyltransferase